MGDRASACRPPGCILALIVFYLILGMFMDVLSMQVATIPITYPIAIALGVDPIWFGIFIVLMCELGLITPPVGMNLFVVHGIRPDKGGIEDAIWGALPYAAIMILFTLLLMARAGPRDLAAGAHVRTAAMRRTLCGSCRPCELQRRYRDGSLTPLAVAQAMPGAHRRRQPAPERRGGAARRRGAGRSGGGDAALRAGRAAVGAGRHPADGEGQPAHRGPADHLGHARRCASTARPRRAARSAARAPAAR